MMFRCRKEMILVALMTFIMAFNIMSFDSQAANKIINLKSDVDILVSPEDGADVLVSFKKGDPVFVTGFQNGYYVVLYQGKTGYFSTSTSLAQSSDVVIDENSEDADGVLDTILEEDDTFDDAGGGDVIAELDSEFKTGAEETEYLVSEIDSTEKARRSSIIWGVIIGLLIILIFALTIVSKVLERKRTKSAEKSEDVAEDVNEVPEEEPDVDDDDMQSYSDEDNEEDIDEESDIKESEPEDNNKEETDEGETDAVEEDECDDEADEVIDEEVESDEVANSDENTSEDDKSEEEDSEEPESDDIIECEFADDLEIIDLDKE